MDWKTAQAGDKSAHPGRRSVHSGPSLVFVPPCEFQVPVGEAWGARRITGRFWTGLRWCPGRAILSPPHFLAVHIGSLAPRGLRFGPAAACKPCLCKP